MTNFHTVDNKELSLKKSSTHPESFHSLFLPIMFFQRASKLNNFPKFMVVATKLRTPGPQGSIFQHPLESEAALRVLSENANNFYSDGIYVEQLPKIRG